MAELPDAEILLQKMILEIAAGTRELHICSDLVQMSLSSVYGKPTAQGMYHGHLHDGVVVIKAFFIAIEDEDARRPHALCGSQDE